MAQDRGAEAPQPPASYASVFKVSSLFLSFSQASLFLSFIHRLVFLIVPSVSPVHRLPVLAKPGLYIFVSVHSEYSS